MHLYGLKLNRAWKKLYDLSALLYADVWCPLNLRLLQFTTRASIIAWQKLIHSTREVTGQPDITFPISILSQLILHLPPIGDSMVFTGQMPSLSRDCQEPHRLSWPNTTYLSTLILPSLGFSIFYCRSQLLLFTFIPRFGQFLSNLTKAPKSISLFCRTLQHKRLF